MLTSSTRLPTYGPRSVTISSSFRPFNRLVTLTRVPNGRFLWAQVMPSILKGRPLAVGSPWKSGPYQLATPNCVLAAKAELVLGTFSSGDLASDRAESTIRAANAQPITRFLNMPPSSSVPRRPSFCLAQPSLSVRGNVLIYPAYEGFGGGVKTNYYNNLPAGWSCGLWAFAICAPLHFRM